MINLRRDPVIRKNNLVVVYDELFGDKVGKVVHINLASDNNIYYLIDYKNDYMFHCIRDKFKKVGK